MAPKKITVIGNGGSGKTTLSFGISSALSLPLHHTDRMIWRAGWVQAPREDIEADLTKIFEQDSWLIDGIGPLWTVEARLPLADCVIFLDFPLEHCLEWAKRRQKDLATVARPDVSEGCLLEGMDAQMEAAIRMVDADYLPVIRRLVAEPRIACKTIHVTDPAVLIGLTRPEDILKIQNSNQL